VKGSKIKKLTESEVKEEVGFLKTLGHLWMTIPLGVTTTHHFMEFHTARNNKQLKTSMKKPH